MADSETEKAKRVTDAMLQMIKFDIATLQAAAEGIRLGNYRSRHFASVRSSVRCCLPSVALLPFISTSSLFQISARLDVNSASAV
jgi:hypothetical protein